MKKKEWKRSYKELAKDTEFYIECNENLRSNLNEMAIENYHKTKEIEELKDVLEFESRVAELLTLPSLCNSYECDIKKPCDWCRLKLARLIVEEEMYGK